MVGFKNDDYFKKAYNMDLIPRMDRLYDVYNDPAAYFDLHKIGPIIAQPGYNIGNALSIPCAVINPKAKLFDADRSDSDKVQRLCRGLILKNNLSNL